MDRLLFSAVPVAGVGADDRIQKDGPAMPSRDVRGERDMMGAIV